MALFGHGRQWGGGLRRDRQGRGDRAARALLPVWTPFWSIDFHRELLRLVDAELAATGLPHTLQPDGAARVRVAGRDTVLDLRALAQAAAPRPVREWPDLIADQVGRHVAAAQAAARFCAQPPPAGDARRLVALTLSTDAAPGPGRRALADGLAAELVYALPTGPVPVPEAHLESWGADSDRLWSTAAENTRAQVRAVVAQARAQHGRYDVVTHPSPFTAATVLCMEELAGPVTPYGVLFGVPSGRELVAHVVTGPEPAAEALRDLPRWVGRRYARLAHPLSPRTYYWRSGQVSAVPPGTGVAELTGELASAR